MRNFTNSMFAEELINYIASSSVEISRDKIEDQRNHFMQICREWMENNKETLVSHKTTPVYYVWLTFKGKSHFVNYCDIFRELSVQEINDEFDGTEHGFYDENYARRIAEEFMGDENFSDVRVVKSLKIEKIYLDVDV